jgi:hypothetical protein
MSSTRDDDAKNKRLFDLRTLERNIKKGLITRKDYEKYLKTLPDVAGLVLPPEEAILDDDEDELDEDEEDDGPAHPGNSAQA